MYFAFIYSKIKYGIEVYGSCSKENLQRLQVIQNGLLKLLLCIDRRTHTNELHRNLRLLKVEHIHKTNILVLVNNCLKDKSIPFFNNYFSFRNISYGLRNQRLDTDRARINVGLRSVRNIGSSEWHSLPINIQNKGIQKNFKKHVASYFISHYID